jgi:hypothetical protein
VDLISSIPLPPRRSMIVVIDPLVTSYLDKDNVLQHSLGPSEGGKPFWFIMREYTEDPQAVFIEKATVVFMEEGDERETSAPSTPEPAPFFRTDEELLAEGLDLATDDMEDDGLPGADAVQAILAGKAPDAE